MKAFSYIFIIYVVFLLTQPCQDVAEMAGDLCDSATVSVHLEQTQERSQDDECLPFCICSCCSHPVGNVEFTFAITSNASATAIYSNMSEYSNPNTQTFRNSIWQPPKA